MSYLVNIGYGWSPGVAAFLALQTKDKSHPGQSRREAGSVKTDDVGNTSTNNYNWQKLWMTNRKLTITSKHGCKMSIEDKRELLFRKQNGKQHFTEYLKELKTIFSVGDSGMLVLSLDETDSLIEQASIGINQKIASKRTVLFDNKEELLRFYIDNCSRLLPGKIYVFTDYSKYCGVAVFDSLIRLNPDFVFNAEHVGIVSILSEDLLNKLILDFYEEGEVFFLEIEVLGNVWGEIK